MFVEGRRGRFGTPPLSHRSVDLTSASFVPLVCYISYDNIDVIAQILRFRCRRTGQAGGRAGVRELEIGLQRPVDPRRFHGPVGRWHRPWSEMDLSTANPDRRCHRRRRSVDEALPGHGGQSRHGREGHPCPVGCVTIRAWRSRDLRHDRIGRHSSGRGSPGTSGMTACSSRRFGGRAFNQVPTARAENQCLSWRLRSGSW